VSGDLDSHWYWFVLGVMAVWRVTHLLHVEHGPWGALTRFRAQAARFGFGDLFACFYCLSFWTAAPAAWWLGSTWPERLVAWLALSAGAILIEVRGIGSPTESSGVEDQRDDLLR
jgi:hypothetical protein